MSLQLTARFKTMGMKSLLKSLILWYTKIRKIMYSLVIILIILENY